MLRRLRDDVVVDADFRIEPEVGLQQRGAGERRQQARGDLLLRDAELQGLGAIDVDLEGRIVLRLGNAEIADARESVRISLLQAQRDVVVGVQIVAVDLRIDRRGQAEIEHLADDVGGLKIHGDVGKLGGQQFADLLLVAGGRLMVGLELDQQVGVLRPDRSRSGKRPDRRRAAIRCCR